MEAPRGYPRRVEARFTARSLPPLEYAERWLAEHEELAVQVGDSFLTGKFDEKPLAGTWPTVSELGRAALRRGDGTDVFEALRSIPPALGRVTHDDDVVLRVRGLAANPRATPVLEGFVEMLELAAARFASDDPAPKLLSADLAGVSETAEAREHLVGKVLLNEDWMLNGGSSGDGEWVRDINERILYVWDVHTVEDYLRAEAESLYPELPKMKLRQPTTDPLERVAAAAAAGAVAEGQPAPEPGPFHPALGTRVSDLLNDGHTDEAVRAGVLGLRDLLRQLSGLPLDGQDLAGAALGGSNPCITLADLSTREGKSEQNGWRKLAEGCFAALRNPIAHRNLALTADEAREALGLMSLLARRLTAASKPDPRSVGLAADTREGYGPSIPRRAHLGDARFS
jgi:uncharacterized protein (TIGR02391 family)